MLASILGPYKRCTTGALERNCLWYITKVRQLCSRSGSKYRADQFWLKSNRCQRWPKSTKLYEWSKFWSHIFLLLFWNLGTSIRVKNAWKKFSTSFSLYDIIMAPDLENFRIGRSLCLALFSGLFRLETNWKSIYVN